jgi:hypothetical protein
LHFFPQLSCSIIRTFGCFRVPSPLHVKRFHTSPSWAFLSVLLVVASVFLLVQCTLPVLLSLFCRTYRTHTLLLWRSLCNIPRFLCITLVAPEMMNLTVKSSRADLSINPPTPLTLPTLVLHLSINQTSHSFTPLATFFFFTSTYLVLSFNL